MKNSVKKKSRIKRWFPAAVWLTAALCFLSGCSFSTTSNTTVALDETGKLTEEIIEELGDDDFTVEELQEYIDEQLAVYNRGKEEPAVTLQTCRVENGDIRLALRYASCDDYAAFNQIVCFQGTLKEAEDAGYTIDTMALLERHYQVTLGRKMLQGLLTEITLQDRKIVLCMPQTYMNASGECVGRLMQWYHCEPDHLMVIYDDIDLPPGRVRVRRDGGPGTHNGMRSIVETLGRQDCRW